MDRIVIHGSPVSPTQQIFVYKDKKVIDQADVSFSSLPDVIMAFVKKYDIKQIDLSGAYSFVKGIEIQLKSAKLSDFSIIDEIHFRYL